MTFAGHWAKKREVIKAAQEDGSLIVIYVKSRIQVAAPFREAFPARARELGGRWLYRSMMWTFPVRSERLVFALLKEFYNYDHI